VTTAPPRTSPAARLPIDPRMRERLIAVRRAEGRRRLRFLCVALAVVLVGAASVGITHSSLVAVHHVEVTGIAHTGRREVLATAGLQSGSLMLNVHPDQMARRLDALPWVETATVSRHWPNSVAIRISERQPVAVVGAGPGRFAVVDLSGRVLAVAPGGTPASAASSASAVPSTSAPPPAAATSTSATLAKRPAGVAPGAASAGSSQAAAVSLPNIVGLDPAGVPGTTFAGDPSAVDALALVAALRHGLAPAIAARVVAVQVAADGQLTATVTPSLSVRFGPPDSVDAKVLALGTLLERADLKGVSTIDVRVPDVPVLTRPSGAGTVSTTPRG
jgi:hypothetical protein